MTGRVPTPTLDMRRLKMDERRLALDERRFALDLQKAARENRFFFRNTGVIITAVVSLSAVTVSGLQLWIANVSNAQIAKSAADDRKNALALDAAEHDAALSLDVAKFLIDHAAAFKSADPRDSNYAVNIVVTLLPQKVASAVALVAQDVPDAVTSRLKDVMEAVSPARSPPLPEGTPIAGPHAVDRIIAEFPEITSEGAGRARLTSLLTALDGWKDVSTNGKVIALGFMLHQAGFFHALTENLNYTADGLLQHWPERFDDVKARSHANEPKLIANYVYNGYDGNKPGSDDGWFYRGRGYTQTTGRTAYAEASKATGVDLVANPDILGGTDFTVDNRVALYEFEARGAIESLNKNDVAGVMRRMLNGYIALFETSAIVRRLKVALIPA